MPTIEDGGQNAPHRCFCSQQEGRRLRASCPPTSHSMATIVREMRGTMPSSCFGLQHYGNRQCNVPHHFSFVTSKNMGHNAPCCFFNCNSTKIGGTLPLMMGSSSFAIGIKGCTTLLIFLHPFFIIFCNFFILSTRMRTIFFDFFFSIPGELYFSFKYIYIILFF